MEPGLLQVFECRESLGILGFWLKGAGPGTCLSLVLTLVQLGLVLAAILSLKTLILRRIAALRKARGQRPAPEPAGPARPGWIDGKPAIYTKLPTR